MPKYQSKYQRKCKCGKVIYGSWWEANEALNVFGPKVRDFDMEIYVCRLNNWHIGHATKKTQSPRKKRKKQRLVPMVELMGVENHI